jgi:hypothetical protein
MLLAEVVFGLYLSLNISFLTKHTMIPSSSVGILRQYTSFRAAVQGSISAMHIGESEGVFGF